KTHIPQFGFGVWQVPPDDVFDAVSRALFTGYRHVDTAAMYANEAGVGEAVRASGLAREQVFLTTKLGNDGHGYDATLAAFEESLKRLGTDYVDLYLIHWPQPARDLYVQSWRAMEHIYANGRARSIGVCNFHPHHLRRLTDETEVLPAVNQIELHPTLAQTELRKVNREMGIATQAWSPLGQSLDLDASTVRAIADEAGRTPAQVILR